MYLTLFFLVISDLRTRFKSSGVIGEFTPSNVYKMTVCPKNFNTDADTSHNYQHENNSKFLLSFLNFKQIYLFMW